MIEVVLSNTAPDIGGQLVAYATAAGVIIAALVQFRRAPSDNRVSNADAALKDTQRFLSQIESLDARLRQALDDLDALRKRCDGFRDQNDLLEDEVSVLKGRCSRLEAQVRRLGDVPVA